MHLAAMNLEEIEDKFERRKSKIIILRGSDNFRRKSCIHKRRFKNMDEAKDFRTGMEFRMRRNDQISDATRVYGCLFCNGFHLTGHLGQEDPHASI